MPENKTLIANSVFSYCERNGSAPGEIEGQATGLHESKRATTKSSPRPLKGRPKPFKTTSLFIPTLELDYQISFGTLDAYSECVKEMGFETFQRNIDRHYPMETPYFKRKVAEFCAKVKEHVENEYPGANVEILNILEKAMQGDQTAAIQAGAFSHWQTVTVTAGLPLNEFNETWRRYRCIEHSMRRAEALFHQERYAETAAEIRNQPDASVYWRHGSLEKLGEAKNKAQALGALPVPFFELQISLAAEKAASHPLWQMARNDLGMGPASFMATGRSGTIKLASKWMKALQKACKSKSQQDLHEYISKKSGNKITLSSLGAYYADRYFPDEEKVMEILFFLREKVQGDLLNCLFFLAREARRVYFTLRTLTWLDDRLEKQSEYLPNYSSEYMDAPNASAWAAQSFEYWTKNGIKQLRPLDTII